MIWAFFELFCVVIAKIEENIYQRRLIKGVIDLLEVFRWNSCDFTEENIVYQMKEYLHEGHFLRIFALGMSNRFVAQI